VSTSPLALPFLDADAVAQRAATAGEPDWLQADRAEGARLAAELPAESNLLFTPYLDLRAVRFGDISLHERTGVAADAGEAPLPAGASAVLHVVEDTVVARALSAEARAAGVIVATFEEVLRERPAMLQRLIAEGDSLPGNDAFGQVARGLHALGVLIHVPDGVTLRDPIVLRWSAGAAGRGLISRSVISLGVNAQARLLEEQTASPMADTSRQSLWWGTTEVHLAGGATLEVGGEQDFPTSTVAFVTRQARVAESAQLGWAIASVGAQLHKSRIDNLLIGRGAGVRQVEIGFGSGSQLFDLTSYTRHLAADTTGDLLSKGVFSGKARGYIKGLIQIARAAKGTDSFLGEFGMLLERSARSVTVPSLEIDQPDVRRAAHSSSVAPIDEAQVFYLMSRGLDRETARRVIVMGFLEPVVARIPLPEAQDRLRELLDRKWPREEGARAAA
jgi:Fe-S cluster assembly protein SufB